MKMISRYEFWTKVLNLMEFWQANDVQNSRGMCLAISIACDELDCVYTQELDFLHELRDKFMPLNCKKEGGWWVAPFRESDRRIRVAKALISGDPEEIAVLRKEIEVFQDDP